MWDRRFRALSWSVLALLTLGWVAYFMVAREPRVRITLEALTVLGLLAGGYRVVRLVRTGRVPSTLVTLLAALRTYASVLASPWVVAGKTCLLGMLVLQWIGRARFSALEYGIVSAVLVAMIAERIVRHAGSRRYRALEALGKEATCPTCPLGFGATGTREAGEGSSPFAGATPEAGRAGAFVSGWDA